MDPDEYKVSRLLPPLMRAACVDQSGVNVSVDCRLYFRCDPKTSQHKGEVKFLTYNTGQISHHDTLPLDSEDGMLWFLDRIGRLGFDLVREREAQDSDGT
jgi:sigma54-dependent transcription regulator